MSLKRLSPKNIGGPSFLSDLVELPDENELLMLFCGFSRELPTEVGSAAVHCVGALLASKFDYWSKVDCREVFKEQSDKKD